jgi:hypothetical protein
LSTAAADINGAVDKSKATKKFVVEKMPSEFDDAEALKACGISSLSIIVVPYTGL